MKLPHLLSTLLLLQLPSICLAATKRSKTEAFSNWHAKSLSSTPLRLDDSNYQSAIPERRDYGIVVVHTALPAQFGCRMCQGLDPEWKILAKSWISGDKEGATRTLFGTIDFSEGRTTFQNQKLETAPVLMYFPPTFGQNVSPSAGPIKFEFSNTVPPTAEQLHTWLSRHVVVGEASIPPVKRPVNWIGIAATTLLGLGGITGIIVAWPFVSWLISSRNLWASFSLVAILLFTSGHMFNSIRGTQYIAGNGQGGIMYFAPGFSNQFGLESQIVAAMYGILAFATISLALHVPRMTSAPTQTVATFVWCGASYFMYSFLMMTFRYKQSGYPYTLPPFSW